MHGADASTPAAFIPRTKVPGPTKNTRKTQDAPGQPLATHTPKTRLTTTAALTTCDSKTSLAAYTGLSRRASSTALATNNPVTSGPCTATEATGSGRAPTSRQAASLPRRPPAVPPCRRDATCCPGATTTGSRVNGLAAAAGQGHGCPDRHHPSRRMLKGIQTHHIEGTCG